jgi:hypothetical protein
MNEREYAAGKLLDFLSQVGIHEAQWAMKTALQALDDLNPGQDHLGAIANALQKAAEPSIQAKPAASLKTARKPEQDP